MYELPLNATPRDVIERSLVCHPSLFSEALSGVAQTHRDASAAMQGSPSQEIATRLATAASVAAQWANDVAKGIGAATAPRVAEMMCAASMDYWITAFNVAVRLQCLPHSQRTEIIYRAQA